MAFFPLLDRCRLSLMDLLPLYGRVRRETNRYFDSIKGAIAKSYFSPANRIGCLRVADVTDSQYSHMIQNKYDVFQLYEDPLEPLILFFILFSVLEQIRDGHLIRSCCVYGSSCPKKCVMNRTFSSAFAATRNYLYLAELRAPLKSKQDMATVADCASCPLCFTSFSEPNTPLIYLVTCEHIFCQDCLLFWMRWSVDNGLALSCPTCKSDLTLALYSSWIERECSIPNLEGITGDIKSSMNEFLHTTETSIPENNGRRRVMISMKDHSPSMSL